MVKLLYNNTGEFPNQSKNVRVKNLYVKTPNYLKEDGTINSDAYGMVVTSIPILGSGSLVVVLLQDGGSGDFGTQNVVIHLIFT